MQVSISAGGATIRSYRSPESLSISMDDRIERIELINGNCVQDYGHIDSGDQISVTALFAKADVSAIFGLWTSRTLVDFTDDGGTVWRGVRIVVRRCRYESRFPDYVNLTFELWRV